MRYAQANLYRNSAKLADEFGWSFACRRFGKDTMNEVAEFLPRYTAGKNKGKVKGRIVWWKAHSNGYAHIANASVRAGTICRVQLYIGNKEGGWTWQTGNLQENDICFADAHMSGTGTVEIDSLKKFQAAVENGRIPVSKVF